jgi:hypothetical protein
MSKGFSIEIIDWTADDAGITRNRFCTGKDRSVSGPVVHQSVTCAWSAERARWKQGATAMNFIFNCPETGRIFETAEFTVIENQGVVIEADGSRRLEARVALDTPCPYCGQRHTYRADEMICPFEAPPVPAQ